MFRIASAGLVLGLLLVSSGCASKHCCHPAVVGSSPCCPPQAGAAYLPATQVPVTVGSAPVGVPQAPCNGVPH